MSEEGALEGVGGETMIRTQSVPSTSGVNGTGSMAELQAKYESLKTKYRVSSAHYHHQGDARHLLNQS